MDKITETLKKVKSQSYQTLHLSEKQELQKDLKEYFNGLKQEKRESIAKSLATATIDETELKDLEIHIKNLDIKKDEILHELDTDNEASDSDSIVDANLEEYEEVYLEEINSAQVKDVESRIINLYKEIIAFKTEMLSTHKEEEPPLEIQVTKILEIEDILENQIKSIRDIKTLNELEILEFAFNNLENKIGSVLMHPNKFKGLYFEKMQIEKGEPIPYKKLIIIRESLSEEIAQLQAKFEIIALDMLSDTTKNYQQQITNAYSNLDQLELLLKQVNSILFHSELTKIEEKIKTHALAAENL